MTDLITTLIQLAISVLVFATLVVYLLIKIPRRYLMKFILIPATLALALFMGLTIPNLLGYAYPGKPNGEFVYLSHTIKDNKVILLANIHGSERLYTFKGNPEILQRLAQAQALTQQGQTVTGKFGKSDGFAFPGLYPSDSPLSIHAPPNYGMLPPKDEHPAQ